MPRLTFCGWMRSTAALDLVEQEPAYDPRPVFDRYPMLVWAQDRVWREQAIAAFEDLRDALGAGEECSPTRRPRRWRSG